MVYIVPCRRTVVFCLQAANDLIHREHLCRRQFDCQRHGVEPTGRSDAQSADNSMASSANDRAAFLTAWSQPDLGDGVV